MSESLLDAAVLTTRTVRINDPDLGPYTVTVPARTEVDAWQFLYDAGGDGVGAVGLNNTYLGLSMRAVRERYYQTLAGVDKAIKLREAQLGAQLRNPTVLYQHTEWATAQRTKVARLFRIPQGSGGVLGGEIRDWKEYGKGGRSLQNLLRRAANAKPPKTPLTGEAALLKILGTVDKPNVDVTARVLRTARFLRGKGGVVLLVPGLALSAYEVWSAPEGQKLLAAQGEAVSWAGGLLAGNLAIGVAMFLGIGGVPLLVIGVVAGVAGALAAEYIFKMPETAQPIIQLRSGDMTRAQLHPELPPAYRLR